MDESGKRGEDGLEIAQTVAEKMDDFYKQEAEVAQVALAFAAMTTGGAGAAVAFVLKVIDLMTEDESSSEAVQQLQSQIRVINRALVQIHERMNEIIDVVAAETNRVTARVLSDLADDIEEVNADMAEFGDEVAEAVRIANKAGNIADKFLRSDFDLWRWTDVVVERRDEQGNPIHKLAPLRFKGGPTLPVYVSALLAWLAAREKAVRLFGRLDDDQDRIRRHLAAVSVRPLFDKYAPPQDPGAPGPQPDSIPQTIAEHIKWRIRAFPVASNAHAENRVCRFFYDVQNWMTGARQAGDNFDLLMAEDNDLCTVDPAMLGSPNLELEAEVLAGLDILLSLATTLERVARTGTVRQQFIGQFPTDRPNPPAVLYVVENNNDLTWYSNLEAAVPGGSKRWLGPNRVGVGWDFATVLSGGDLAIYGLASDTLRWHGHDGHNSGAPDWRPFPIRKRGWGRFERVFSGGESIIYGITPDGLLWWHRHDGWRSGSSTEWSGPKQVGEGWSGLHKVFSGGSGVIYVIDQAGTLTRFVHKGYLDGTFDWEDSGPIGTGFADFREVIAAANGVIYLFTHDGRVLRRRWVEEKVITGVGFFNGESGLEFTINRFLDEAVEIRSGMAPFRQAFALMESPEGFIGPN